MWRGRGEIEGMLAGNSHQLRVVQGCAHQVSMPRITVDGDRAVALAYQQLVQCREDGTFFIDRQTANRWELEKTKDGWHVVKRSNGLLDGRQESRQLFAETLAAED